MLRNNFSYYLFSLGCKVNTYETFSIGQELLSLGGKETKDIKEADVIILNTCSVTGMADKKSRQHIRSFRQNNSHAILVAMGCYTQKNGEEAIECGADIVIGTTRRNKIIPYIKSFSVDKKPILDIKANIRSESYEDLVNSNYKERVRAYVKIQDGCNHFCSYCLIPFVRGVSRSRKKELVLEEVKNLVQSDYKEIVITGIDIGSYGKDLYGDSYGLSNLLEEMILANPELKRIRISSIDFTETDEYFLSLLKKYPQIVSHLHISLQSGSSSVLGRMKRNYDVETFREKVNKIREIRPDIAITTDIIVGFPLETEQEWKETVEFCKDIKFAEIHVFPFSSREGTAASRMKDVNSQTKKRRVNELLALSKSLRNDYKSSFYNKDMEVLFEKYDKEKKICYGHTSNYLLVGVNSNEDLTNKFGIVNYNSSVAID